MAIIEIDIDADSFDVWRQKINSVSTLVGDWSTDKGFTPAPDDIVNSLKDLFEKIETDIQAASDAAELHSFILSLAVS